MSMILGVVADVPPGVQPYPPVRYDFVFTGPGDLGLLHFGEFQDKVYWYFYTKLVDENSNYIGYEHPTNNPEFVQFRVRFTNGLMHIPLIENKPIKKLHVSIRYCDENMKILFQHSIYNATADKVNDHVVLEKRTPDEWAMCRYIVLTPLMLLDAYSVDTGQSPHVEFKTSF